MLISTNSLISLLFGSLFVIGCSEARLRHSEVLAPQSVLASQPISAHTGSHELSLNGISLSCRTTYVQAINDSQKDSNSDIDTANRASIEANSIIDAYLANELYEKAFEFVQPGSLGWLEIAKKYARKGYSERVLQILKTNPPKLEPEKQLVFLTQVYLAIGDPKQALHQAELMDPASKRLKAKLLAEIAALFESKGQHSESVQTFRQAVNLVRAYDPKLSTVLSNEFFAHASKSYADVGQIEEAKQIAEQISDYAKDAKSGWNKQLRGRVLLGIVQSYTQTGQPLKAIDNLFEVEEINLDLEREQHRIDSILAGSSPISSSHIVFSTSLAESTILAYADLGKFQKAIDLSATYAGSSKAQQALFLLKISRKAWSVNQKQIGQTLVDKAFALFNLTDDKQNSYYMLQFAEGYREIGQIKQSKKLVDIVYSKAHAMPFHTTTEATSRTKLFNEVFKNYAALGAYSQALVVAKDEANQQERDRLVKLVQCTTR